MQPGVPPLVEHADEEEQRAGRDAVADHHHQRALHALHACRAQMPSITKPRWLTDE